MKMAETIKFKGDLTINELSGGIIDDLRSAVTKFDELMVDTREVDRVDVAAIQMFVAAWKESEARGCCLTLLKSEAVADMLSLIGVQI
ncbi:MAG: STAS domain-containing protein [Nitrospirae bacterium]|nr:STAS domain-containing protein [Nitrospirota bacterium]